MQSTPLYQGMADLMRKHGLDAHYDIPAGLLAISAIESIKLLGRVVATRENLLAEVEDERQESDCRKN